MRAVIVASAYGVDITDCRRLTDSEKAGYAAWCKDLILIGTGHMRKLNNLTHNDVWNILKDRQSDGTFLGCDNSAWTINETEEAALIKLDSEKAKAKVNEEIEQVVINANDYQDKIDEAKSTGKPVELKRYITNRCHENLIDCSFDLCIEYIDANGKITYKYEHKY